MKAISQELREHLKTSWQRQSDGLEPSHRVTVLPPGVSFTPFPAEPVDNRKSCAQEEHDACGCADVAFDFKSYSKTVSCPLPQMPAGKALVAAIEGWLTLGLQRRTEHYENALFPLGNFYRTHKLWTNEKYDKWDHLLCFFGLHPIEFFTAGITPHCACCHYHHSTTFIQRLRYWRSS